MAIFSSKLLNYQRVDVEKPPMELLSADHFPKPSGFQILQIFDWNGDHFIFLQWQKLAFGGGKGATKKISFGITTNHVNSTCSDFATLC